MPPAASPCPGGKYPEQGFLLPSRFSLASFPFSFPQIVALCLYTWDTEIAKLTMKSPITVLVDMVQMKGLCYALRVNDPAF